MDEDQVDTVNRKKKKKHKFQENTQTSEADMGDSLLAEQDQNKMQSSVLDSFRKRRKEKKNADALWSEGILHKLNSKVRAEAEEFDNEKQSSATLISETKKKKLMDGQVAEDVTYSLKDNVEMITAEDDVNASEGGGEMQLSQAANNDKKYKKKKFKRDAFKRYNGEICSSPLLLKVTMVDSTKEAEFESEEGCTETQFSLEKKEKKKKRGKKNAETEEVTHTSVVILGKTTPEDETDHEDRLLPVENEKREKGSKKSHANCLEGIPNHKTDGNRSKSKEAVKDVTSKGETVLSEEGNSNPIVDPNKLSDVTASSQSKNKSKRVSFSGNVEVFSLSKNANDQEDLRKVGLVIGKRFSLEEDEMIKKAVYNYIKAHNLSEEGLHKVMYPKDYPEVKGCWKEISESLPWRPYMAIRKRGDVIFKRSEIRKFTPEEIEIIQRHHEAHGNKWVDLALALGKHRIHVKDAYRRTKLKHANKGRWTQDERQILFDLVNVDLRNKVSEEQNSKYRMRRENISWEAISEKMGTRHPVQACLQWYNILASPMVKKGLWCDRDDYRLIHALLKLDVCCIEDIDWDNILEHRSGEICRKRWVEMTRHVGGYKERSFVEQVELLATRYRIEMLQYRPGTAEKEEEEE